MARSWIFLINPFISATNDSYRKMKQIGDYTLSALNANNKSTQNGGNATPPNDVFSTIITELDPLVTAYDSAYEAWLSQQGAQKGQTQSLTNLLQQLSSTKIEDWDLAVQTVYRQKTPQYLALLPHRRQPFQKGSQQDRIAAVGAFSIAIGSDAALQNIKTDVNSFYDELVAANDNQKGSKATKLGSSDDVEAKRIALANGLYGALGMLIDFYKNAPETVSNFFLLEALRSHDQTVFEHDIKVGGTRLALTHTFETGDMIMLTNRGNMALQFALSADKDEEVPPTAFTLPPNEEQTIAPDALGAAGNRFLLVKNTGAKENGAYTIELV